MIKVQFKTQAGLLGISYSSLFYESVPPCACELAIKRSIDEIYTATRADKPAAVACPNVLSK
jgi:hypothetical protein